MNRRVKIVAFFLVTLSVCGYGGIKLGTRMQATIDKANRLNKIQPAPKLDMPVRYHGADIIKFVDDEHFLVGSLKFDIAGTPEYGPIIMYHLPDLSELWRIKRKGDYAARYDLVALQPNLVIRSAVKGKIVHAAYDVKSGRSLWKNTMKEGGR